MNGDLTIDLMNFCFFTETYIEAEEKIRQLMVEYYAFSTDNANSAKTKVAKKKKIYKFKAVNIDEELQKASCNLDKRPSTVLSNLFINIR